MADPLYETIPPTRGLTVRPATLADSRRLFGWRNDPGTRAMCLDTGLIDRTAHGAWLKRTLSGEARKLWMVEKDGTPIATGRFDYCEETEFSWTIAPEWRGKGIALRIANLLFTLESKFVGCAKRENTSSWRICRAAGMALVEDGPVMKWAYGYAAVTPYFLAPTARP